MTPQTASAGAPREVIIVGLGTVAETHINALETIPGVAVVVGVDTAPPARPPVFRGRRIPVYPRLENVAGYNPTVVVVATPTPTHAAVCDEVAEMFPAAEILLEKPAADNLADARRVLHDIGDRQVVNVAYHMAFSPEVTWGQRLVAGSSDILGPPLAITAWFSDPYETDPATAQARFGSSWVDSGINALSVINRFAEPIERTSLRTLAAGPQSVFEGRVRCRAGGCDIEALILTSWHVTAPGRVTRIRYGSGAELVLDHHAVSGYLIHHGAITEYFGSDGRIPGVNVTTEPSMSGTSSRETPSCRPDVAFCCTTCFSGSSSSRNPGRRQDRLRADRSWSVAELLKQDHAKW
jgi:predicted dehydrogenase